MEDGTGAAFRPLQKSRANHSNRVENCSAMKRCPVSRHDQALTWPTPQMKKGRPKGSP